MGLFRSFGNLVQKFLFTTTFDDLLAGLDDVQRRINALEQKIEDRTGELERKLTELQGQSDSGSHAQAS